jgi:hypothetical protein
MKKSAIILFVAATIFLFAPAVVADTITTLSQRGPYSWNNVGELTLLPLGSTLTGWVSSYDPRTRDFMQKGTFQSFCLEAFEYLPLNTTYNAVPNTRAVEGGIGPAGDPISKGTAYLYYQFASGTLAGYDYADAIDRTKSAEGLQKAIWALEDEGGDISAYQAMLIAKFGSIANAKADNNGEYAVMALNVTLNGEKHQDVLIKTPEPFTLLLLGLGLLGVVGIRRKFKI